MTEMTPFAAVIDLETTGLSAEEDVPLEIAIRVIDKRGQTIGEKSWLIWEANEDFQRGVERGRQLDFVCDMHEISGLWDDLDEIDNARLHEYSRETVAREAAEFVAHYTQGRPLPMMGNSIGSLDRPFVMKHLGKLNDSLSYRNIDISSVMQICRAVNPDLAFSIQADLEKRVAGSSPAHRAAGDIEYCVQQYRSYCENFFFVGPEW